jgi:hypothetical protein
MAVMWRNFQSLQSNCHYFEISKGLCLAGIDDNNHDLSSGSWDSSSLTQDLVDNLFSELEHIC